MKYLHLTWSNLRRKKLRTALTLLSIVVAFVLFGFLCAVKQALTGGVTLESAKRLMVMNKVTFIQPLPQSYQARIERVPGVQRVTHCTWFGGIFQDPKNFFAQMPVVPEPFLEMYPEFLLPEDQKKAWMSTRTGAIVGRKSAERFGWKIGQKIPIQSTIYPREGGSFLWEFDLVGIFDGKDKNTDVTAMYFRYDYFEEARSVNKGQVGWYMMRVEDPAQAAGVARKVDEEFANSPAETKTESEEAMAQSFAKQIGNIALITAAILGAVFFILLLVTANTISQSVRERTGELGVLKAIGFTNGQVLGLVLAESMTLSVLGGSVGLVLAWMVTSQGDPTGMLPLFHFPARDVVVGVGVAFLLGLVTGVLPAIEAMRLRVADALRRI